MTHLDEGRLLALRDEGITGDPDMVAHLASCEICQSTLDGVHRQKETIIHALTALDEDVDVDAARAAVRARLAGAAVGSADVTTLSARRPWPTRAALSRAAGLILLTAAGAAAAIPGSPVRSWIGGVLSDRGTPAVSPTAADAEAAAEEHGIRLSASTGPIRIVLLGLDAGDEVRVRLVPGTEAAVFAPSGSRFTSAEGRIEAAVVSGPVRVEVPRDVVPVTLEVNGRTYVRSTPTGVDVTGPVPEQVGQDLVFRLPDSG